jgi:hypothetical protein
MFLHYCSESMRVDLCVDWKMFLISLALQIMNVPGPTFLVLSWHSYVIGCLCNRCGAINKDNLLLGTCSTPRWYQLFECPSVSLPHATQHELLPALQCAHPSCSTAVTPSSHTLHIVPHIPPAIPAALALSASAQAHPLHSHQGILYSQ